MEIKKFFELGDNSDTYYQNVWHTTKAVLRGKFTALNAYMEKPKREQRDNLRSHFMELEKRANPTQSQHKKRKNGGQEFKTSLANMVKPHLYKNTKVSWVWWHIPVVSATREAEVGESLEPGRQRLQ